MLQPTVDVRLFEWMYLVNPPIAKVPLSFKRIEVESIRGLHPYTFHCYNVISANCNVHRLLYLSIASQEVMPCRGGTFCLLINRLTRLTLKTIDDAKALPTGSTCGVLFSVVFIDTNENT